MCYRTQMQEFVTVDKAYSIAGEAFIRYSFPLIVCKRSVEQIYFLGIDGTHQTPSTSSCNSKLRRFITQKHMKIITLWFSLLIRFYLTSIHNNYIITHILEMNQTFLHTMKHHLINSNRNSKKSRSWSEVSFVSAIAANWISQPTKRSISFRN